MSWKKIIKRSELIPFPPGSGTEENWMFPYDIQESFVQSPRNRRRLSSAHSHSPGHFEGMTRDQRLLHMVNTGLGTNHLIDIDLDDLDAIDGVHLKLPHL